MAGASSLGETDLSRSSADQDRHPDASREDIFARFRETALQHPDRLAIASDALDLTYGELLRRSVTLAQVIQERVGQSGQPVAILGQRRAETPLAMLACLLAGVPFVVLDAAYPASRITELWGLAGATALLHCGSDPAEHLRQLRGAIAEDRLIEIDRDWVPREDEPQPFAGEAAYMLFTSGTTGLPKKILVGQAPLAHFVTWYAATFRPGVGTRFSMLSGLGHDPVMRDVFVPLLIGGEIHIPRQEIILKPGQLHAWMREADIQFAHMTPQMIDLLAPARGGRKALSGLSHVFCGGDVLRPATVQTLREIAPDAVVVNFYGTSETPQAMAWQVIGEDMAAPYPLGLPIDDVRIFVVDDVMAEVAPGEPGEIVIETRYLSLGYDAPGLEGHPAFAAGLTGDDPLARSYRTGDIGFKDETGRLHFCGRRDDQVKIRGYRVDCREVAAAIERHGLARQAVVFPETDAQGEVSLTAYVTGGRPDLRKAMAEFVPQSMIPAEVIAIEQAPLLANGKVDRAALRAMRNVASPAGVARADDPLTAELLEIASRSGAGPEQSFVEAGGDSLSFVKASLIIEDHLGFLPEGWEDIPLGKLHELKRPDHDETRKRSGWLRPINIELTVLLRAVSIMLVVVGHAGGYFATGSSTLFVISGMSFARFLLPGILFEGKLTPTLVFVAKYAIPAGLWQASRSIAADKVWLPDLFLMGTLWQPSPIGHFTLWFLDVLTACILVMSASCLLFGQVGRRAGGLLAGMGLMPFLLAVLAVSSALYLVQVDLGWWNGKLGETSCGPFRWLWMFALGACIQAASSKRHQWLLVGIFAAMVVLVNLYEGYGHEESILSDFFLAGVVLLIFVKKIFVTYHLRRVVAIIASSSLFIYIVNYAVITRLMPAAGLDPSPWTALAASLAIGIVMARGWETAIALLERMVRRFDWRRAPAMEPHAIR